jgi:hypothetical protein
MNATRRLFSFALLTSCLVAPTALARDRDDDRRERREYHERREHRHHEGCYHGPGERPAPRRANGRYELQTVSVWVPGYHEEVWVPEVCKSKPHRNVARCRGGYYDRQWVEGHYAQRQQWVWVAAPAPVVYPPPPPRPGWNVRVSASF